MDYINPFSGMPNPQVYPNTPLMAAFSEGQRQRQAAPFIQNTLQSQETNLAKDKLDLQKSQAEFGEWSNPESVAARRSKRLFEGEEAEQKRSVLPSEYAAKKAQYDSDIALIPERQRLELKQITEKLDAANYAPEKQLRSDMADLYMAIKDLPPAVQAQQYGNAVASWRRAHPTAQMPPEFNTFSGHTMDYLKYNFLTNFNSVQHQQDIAKAKIPGEAQKDVERMRAASAEKVGAAHDATQIRVAELNAGRTQGSAPAQKLAMERELADPKTKAPGSEARRQQLEDTLAAEYETELNSDPMLKSAANSMAIAAMDPNTPAEKLQQMQDNYTMLRGRALMNKYRDKGIRPPISMMRRLYPQLQGADDASIRASTLKTFGVEVR